MKDESNAGKYSRAGTSATGDKVPLLAEVSAPEYANFQSAVDLAVELFESTPARTNIPIRRSFVQNKKDASGSPLSKLVGRGGRGGAVAAKLYVALIWRCSAQPFSTEVPPRTWAALLGLEDPTRKGARRITNALDLLETEKLLKLKRSRGVPSKIVLLDESGDETPYLPPSEAYQSGQKKRDIYFRMPVTLWTGHKAHAQRMTSGALGMLLILLDSGSGAPTTFAEGTEQWWSVDIFQKRYTVSSPMRSRGTKELIEMGLLYVRRQSVPSYKGQGSFSKEKVRNIYRLQNAALVRSKKSLGRPDLPKASTLEEKMSQLPNIMRAQAI